MDIVLIERGVFKSRSAAKAAISAGKVRVDGHLVSKPSEIIAPQASIDAEPAHPYVSRAALKLAHALDAFGIDVAEKVCLDIGSSTGGFTQVLLQRGAAHVTAVDVGHGQMHASLLGEDRLTLLEGVDARDLDHDHVTVKPDIITVDASFIGLEKLLGPALSIAAPGAILISLFKPQFQVGPEHVGKGGIVSNRSAAAAAEERYIEWLNEQGWDVSVDQRIDSPITGGDGNAERLVLARLRASNGA